MIEYAQIIASSRVHKFLYNYSELLASPISMLEDTSLQFFQVTDS